MNPYNRFTLVSSSVTAALILAALAIASPHILNFVNQFDGSVLEVSMIGAGAVTVIVVFWMAFTEVILPSLFRLDWVRQTILGRYYIEGTWLQAEKGKDQAHIAVIDIQPDGKSFTFSGYALDENLDVNSNVLIELARIDWPFLTYKYRNSLSDGADGQRDGVGEIQFEMNRSAAQRYNGFSQFIKNDERVRLEGAKIVRNRDVKRLRSLEGREEIIDQYWDLFFGRGKRRKAKLEQAAAKLAAPLEATPVADVAPVVQAAPAPAPEPVAETAPVVVPEPVVTAPVTSETETLELNEAVSPVAERRNGMVERPSDLEESVIPRRRMADWTDEADAQADSEVSKDSPVSKADKVEAETAKTCENKASKGEKPQGRKPALDTRHVM